MFRLIAWVMAGAFAVSGWRNLPPLPQPTAGAAGLSIAGCVLLAYYAGTRRKRDQAVAVAVARAEARAAARSSAAATAVNHVQVVVPQFGARAAGAAAFGLDEAPWLIGTQRAVEVEENEALEAALADALDAEADR